MYFCKVLKTYYPTLNLFERKYESICLHFHPQTTPPCSGLDGCSIPYSSSRARESAGRRFVDTRHWPLSRRPRGLLRSHGSHRCQRAAQSGTPSLSLGLVDGRLQPDGPPRDRRHRRRPLRPSHRHDAQGRAAPARGGMGHRRRRLLEQHSHGRAHMDSI